MYSHVIHVFLGAFEGALVTESRSPRLVRCCARGRSRRTPPAARPARAPPRRRSSASRARPARGPWTAPSRRGRSGPGRTERRVLEFDHFLIRAILPEEALELIWHSVATISLRYHPERLRRHQTSTKTPSKLTPHARTPECPVSPRAQVYGQPELQLWLRSLLH